jgi:hypothetical protein
MAEAIYLLCALASIVCAFMLARAYTRTRMRLLLWSAACFAGLCLNNMLMFIDLVIIPEVDAGLVPIRLGVSLIGMAVMVYGLIWDAT